jgi:diaminopimelate decarboxylase
VTDAVPPPDAGTVHPMIEAGMKVGGMNPADLVRAHGSPLFVYDLDVVSARVAALRAALPVNAEVAFAVKSNPNPALLGHLAGLGLGADVASMGELEAVTRAGFDLRKVVFTGPGKTDAEIARAIRSGIRALTVESLEELEVVIDLASVAAPRQGLLLRLAIEGAGTAAEATPIISGPGAGKFGLTPDEVDQAVDMLQLAGAIGSAGAPFELLGLHAFGASNVREAARLVDGVRNLAARAEALAAKHGLKVRLMDGGGGLGIPYADLEAPLDLEALRDGLAAEVATWASRPGIAGAGLLFEPGRFIAGPAGASLMRVVRTKQRGGRTIAVTDGGIHHLMRPALIGEAQRTVLVGEAATREGAAAADVVGPLCTGLDVLATDVTMAVPRTGDIVAIRDTGAYGFTESMPYFLSHPIPAEVCLRDGRVVAARPRQAPRL